jgi:hypothetical protein
MRSLSGQEGLALRIKILKMLVPLSTDGLGINTSSYLG